MHHAKLIRYGFASLVLVATVAAGSLHAIYAQDKAKNSEAAKKKEITAGGDPFRKYQPSRVAIRPSNLVSPPSLQQRIEQYRAQKQAAMNAHVHAPKPTTALLLGELQVVGITRTPRGYAAIVEATPIKLSYVVYPGERFFDGQLVAIEDARLVFRHETIFTDGKRELSVETKNLRLQAPIDAMTAAKAATTSDDAPAADQKKPEPKPSATEKP
jgi:hypothetical protein